MEQKTAMRDIKKKYTLGIAQQLWKCCREIRYAGLNPRLYDVLSGFNSTTEQVERWVVIRLSKKWSEHILQQIISDK